MIRAAKKFYFKNAFSTAFTNIKKTWDLIRKSTGLGKARKDKIVLINSDGIKVNESDVPNVFNEYFVNAANNLINDLPPADVPFTEYLNTPVSHTIFLAPTNPFEVSKTINSLKNKNGILCKPNVYAYKLVGDNISEPLSIIFNAIVNTGVYPDSLKIACVTPIHKKDSTFECSNYRPISSLPILNKIFEKLIYSRLSSFIEKNKILSNNQFGFRKGRSVEDAINCLLHNIYKSLNEKKSAGTLFLDFSRAFDVINHNILIYKLNHYGMRGRCSKLVESYLSSRQQFVFANGHKSGLLDIDMGVPQGSILGPLFFLLYVNDLPFVLEASSSVLYADDTTLVADDYHLPSLLVKLKSDLNNIHKWVVSNRLILNFSKTKLMIFTNKNYNLDIQFIFRNINIDIVDQHNFLGLIIDSNLNFKFHIQHVCSKVSKAVGVLYKLSLYMPSDILKILYHALATPYFTYCVSVWGCAPQYLMNRPFILQKRLIRIVAGASYLAHTNPLFISLNILKLQDLYELRCLIFIFKVFKCDSNYYVIDFINTYQIAHDHDTRTQKIRLPAVSLLQYKHSVVYKSISLWNNLPNNIKSANNVISLKRLFTSHKLSFYID